MTFVKIALGLLLLFVAAGRFLPGPRFWGFNHLAYLSTPIYVSWLVCAALLLLPSFQARLATALEAKLPRLLERWSGAILLAGVAAILFVLFREQSYFMGDGYLVGELVERGMKFRAFDNMDYMLHYATYQAQPDGAEKISSFTIYRAGSVLAGTLGTLLLWWLTRKLPWEGWRRLLVLGFFLLAGPVALFHGYVESYSWLFLFVSAFLVAGVLTLEGVVGIWLASTLFGAALFFHLTAVFSGPALLYLAWKAPARPAWKRWADAAVPALVIFLVSVVLHLAAGYDATWFRREFVESRNAQSIWIPLGGDHGLLSAYHWKDLFNLLLITSPAAVVILLGRIGALRSRISDRRVQFALVQVATIAFFSVALDRKLGGARDWDLLAAHSLGIGLLAALLLPPWPPVAPAPRSRAPLPPEQERTGSTRIAALVLTVAFLMTAPWVALLHHERASIARFVDVAADFPDFARAYAYEEVGKYYRKAENYDMAEQMYRRCVDTYPGNPRFHVLLGSIYMVQSMRTSDQEEKTARMDQAEAAYREALRLKPDVPLALSNLARALMAREKYSEALPLYERLVLVEPRDFEHWAGLGNARLQQDDPAGAVTAYESALQRNPNAPVKKMLGAALLGTRRYSEAAAVFSETLRGGDRDPRVLYGLASARVEEARQAAARGQPLDPGRLTEAENLLRELLQADSRHMAARSLLQRIEDLRAGS